MKVRSGYKIIKSVFGKELENPNEWEYSQLENIVSKHKGSIRMGPFGSSLKKHELLDKGKIKTLWIENIVKNRFSLEYKKFISEEKYKDLESFTVKPYDVLITMMGTLGRVSIVPSDIGTAIISSHLLKITLDMKKMIPGYLFYYLLSNHTSRQLIRESRGIVMGGLNTSIIKSLLITVPSKKEQEKITSILSDIDNLLDFYFECIQTTKNLKKALMQQLLTKGIGHKKFKKVTWLFGEELEIPEEWEIKPMDKISQKILDGEHISPEYAISGIPYLSSRHIKSKISFHNCKYVSNETFAKIIQRIHPEYDDILITVKGTIGFCKRLDIREKFCMDRNVGLIKPLKKIVDSVFLEQIMKSTLVQKQILRLMDNNVIPSLYLNQIRTIKIFLPSINEQQKIVSKLSNVDSKIIDLESKKSYLETIKKGLMQKLLIGQIRIRV